MRLFQNSVANFANCKDGALGYARIKFEIFLSKSFLSFLTTFNITYTFSLW